MKKRLIQCPDDDTLALFLEQGLTESQNDQIVGHLEQCDECLQKVASMRNEERNLIASLCKLPPKKIQKGIRGKECPEEGILWAYAEGSLPAERQEQVEDHLHACDYCLEAYMDVHEYVPLSGIEIDIASELGRLRKKSKPSGMLELVLKIREKSLEVLRHTGELLVGRVPQAAVRGGRGKKKTVTTDKVSVRKDFEDTSTSVEITVEKGTGRGISSVKVSVMDLTEEEFLEGITVSLASGKQILEMRTDREGIAEFQNISPGEYVLKFLNREGQQLGSGNLTIKPE